MNDKVYILMRIDWDGDSDYESIISVYQKMEEAEAEKERLTKIVESREANEYYDRFEEKLNSLLNYHLGKNQPDKEDEEGWNKWLDEYNRIDKAIQDKFISKYPNMVSIYCNPDDCPTYYVKAIDFV